MQGQIQFIQITPEEQENRIVARLQKEIEKLKSDFQPKKPTEYLTRQEVQELLKVDLSTVHNWTRKGKLKSYGIGGRIYFKRSEVEEAIKPIN